MVMELCECSLFSLIHEGGEEGGGLEVDEKFTAMVSFLSHLPFHSTLNIFSILSDL